MPTTYRIHSDSSGAFPERADTFKRLPHFVFTPDDADLVLHHFLQILLHLVRPVRLIEIALEWFQSGPRRFVDLPHINLA